MSILSANGIEKSFGSGSSKTQVLTSASFAMEQGEFVTILGPSGSGKSTLLNICGLIDSSDAGELFHQNQNLLGLSEKQKTEFRRQHMGFIFQSFNLVPVMSVAANVGYPLMLLDWNAQEKAQRIAEVLEQVGLSDFAAKRPEQLSGGQCQRVAIARALVKKPTVIIADEPTASLDADTALMVVELMKDLAKEQGSACLVATHDSRLLPFSDQVLHVDHGRIVNEDDFSRVKLESVQLSKGVHA